MLRLALLTLLASAQTIPPGTEREFCANTNPGVFSRGCSSNVVFCNRFGGNVSLVCPYGLVFDQLAQECKDQTLVAECRNTPPNSGNMGRSLDGLPPELCFGLLNGFHSATPCSTSVVICRNGVPSLLECREGEVFDNSRSMCVPVREVSACGQDNANECQRLSDGIFAKGKCLSFYLTCSGGVSRIMGCPANLVFDSRLSVCNYPNKVEGCTSVPNGGSDICPQDGFYSYGNCSDIFYGCTNGRQIAMYCPAKLAFDETRQLCDYPLAVSSCIQTAPSEDSGDGSGIGSGESSGDGYGYFYEETSGYAPGYGSGGGYVELIGTIQPTYTKTAAPSSLPPIVTTTPQPSSQPAQTDNFCANREDGFYASGCSSDIIACVARRPTSMTCPANLIFDEQKQICEYPMNVPCYINSMGNNVKKREACYADGPSPDGPCSNTYTQCRNGRVYHFVCERGHVFAMASRKCVASNRVSECSPVASGDIQTNRVYSSRDTRMPY